MLSVPFTVSLELQHASEPAMIEYTDGSLPPSDSRHSSSQTILGQSRLDDLKC